MDPAIFYSARREDLYFAARRGRFFPAGYPATEAALCAEMSRLAYSRRPESYAFDRRAVRGALAAIGFTQCRFIETHGRFRAPGSHCFLAVRGNRHDPSALAVLCFRGTDIDDPANWLDGADMLHASWQTGGQVHRGFARALLLLLPEIDRALAPLRCRLLLTGHSLGATMATLLASIHRSDAVYTFGSPRVGDREFAATLHNVQIQRYVDCCDIITRLLPEGMDYAHVGELHYIGEARRIVVEPAEASMAADRARARWPYLKKYAGRPGNVLARDFADHAPINYVAPLMPILDDC